MSKKKFDLENNLKLGNSADDTPLFNIMNTDLHIRDCFFFNESGKLTAQFFKISQNSIAYFQNISLKVKFVSITSNNVKISEFNLYQWHERSVLC